jgi:hypothetical protein
MRFGLRTGRIAPLQTASARAPSHLIITRAVSAASSEAVRVFAERLPASRSLIARS